MKPNSPSTEVSPNPRLFIGFWSLEYRLVYYLEAMYYVADRQGIELGAGNTVENYEYN